MGHPAQAAPSFDDLYAQIRALPEHLTGEILEPGVPRTARDDVALKLPLRRPLDLARGPGAPFRGGLRDHRHATRADRDRAGRQLRHPAAILW
ncbi:hypothetical protein [Chondromyces apiculatus]|uniref:hypothetical protein n=1 Tax=Chondromyces apiculatus TaxID=51 RepID=UPI001E2E6D3E|nr:hypothetical protein [Chondromyces apiculatus]